MNYAELRSAAQSGPTAVLSPDFDIFTHHFPTAPILPGALSAVLLSDSCGGATWFLKKMTGVRFRKPLSPNLPLQISSEVRQECAAERTGAGKIQSGTDLIADGEFVFAKEKLAPLQGSSAAPEKWSWDAGQIRDYLPHGGPIVLIDQLVSSKYPPEIQAQIEAATGEELDQTKLVGTKIHARSTLQPGSFWLEEGVLPSPVLCELVAQASALTLTPFFSGTKPQVALLGCDAEFFGLAQAGSTIDTYVDLSRAKRMGKSANMIQFKCECFVGEKKLAQVNLNAMANFA